MEAESSRVWVDLSFAQRKYPEAIIAFQRCLGLNASDLRTWYNLADACVFENRYKEADAAYEQGIVAESAFCGQGGNRHCDSAHPPVVRAGSQLTGTAR